MGNLRYYFKQKYAHSVFHNIKNAGDAVTHKIGWDENGKNILIPVEAEA